MLISNEKYLYREHKTRLVFGKVDGKTKNSTRAVTIHYIIPKDLIQMNKGNYSSPQRSDKLELTRTACSMSRRTCPSH